MLVDGLDHRILVERGEYDVALLDEVGEVVRDAHEGAEFLLQLLRLGGCAVPDEQRGAVALALGEVARHEVAHVTYELVR